MQAKALELRDKLTFIALLAVDMNPSVDLTPDDFSGQRYLLRRVGYPCTGEPNIVITKLSADGGKASNDPYYWDDRTFATAHNYIIEHWSALKSGDVIDVEFILGETAEAKKSERFTSPF